MAFVLRQPFTLSSALKRLPKSTAAATRALHTPPFRTNALSKSKSKPASPIFSLAKSRHAFQSTFRRTYMQQPSEVVRPDSGNLTQRLLYGAGIVGGTVLATNLIFNRETREDGGMPPFERQYLNDTFLHTGLGIGIIGVAAQALHRSGWSYRIMLANPWLVVGVGLAASLGTMYACRATSPENYVQKYALWGGFNIAQAAVLSPLLFLQPVLLAQAGLYTVAMMGSIAFVGATAKQEKYLYLGGPLLAGAAIVVVSGLAPLVLPAAAARTLIWTERLWLYGGLAVFGGFTLYDVQKILHHSRMAERGLIRKDAVNESISLELDFLNIFIRFAQILAMRSSNRK